MRRIRGRFLSLAASLPLLSACSLFGRLNSSTLIEPGQAFRLGGDQGGAFTVRGRNAGSVPVIVYSESNGPRDSVVTLAPGDPVDARFGARTTAIFRNPSTQRAVVSIVVTGDTRALGMRYERTRPSPTP